MTSLRPNLVKRIERLPKPTNVASAMQPLFEAVSNAIHSTQERYKERVASDGKVTVTVNTNRSKDDVWATVEDNGYGLTEKNWDAFTTTDTDNKIEAGGKGVGRLIWLDCFQDIHVISVYASGDGRRHRRSFKFRLALEDQIESLAVEKADDAPDSSFIVKFSGLRDNGYHLNFPGRGNFVFQHLTSHFLPAFIGGRSPQVTVHVGDETRDYPSAISEIVHRNEAPEPLDTEEYGQLYLTLMECDKVASSDLKGRHFVHFIAHDRTVHSQCIDGKLGLAYFGDKGDRVFHAILTGEYLDQNVNQERTAFVFEDVIIDRMINDVCFLVIERFLAEPLEKLKREQRGVIPSFSAGFIRRTYAAIFSFIAGVMPPMPMFGRSLL